MNDLISRQAVFDLLDSWDCDTVARDAFWCDIEDIPPAQPHFCRDCKMTDDKMKEYIVHESDLTNTANAVELIRCKDCKYYDHKNGWCEFVENVDALDECFYCANAQR